MPGPQWHDLGAVTELAKRPLQQIEIGRTRIALSHANGEFSAVSGVCNHVGGPLGEGRLEGDYIVCPWHNWKYHRRKGCGEPGFESETIPCYDLKIEGGRVWLDLESATKRHKVPHAPHPLARALTRQPGGIRIAGISTTAMDYANPRVSTSEELLNCALDHAARELGAECRLIRLGALRFRNCEGYYSKSAQACTWPCSITQMDPEDQMEQVYEAMVHWADAILLATPIRWGAASALYYKMAERLNCVQNQVTIRDRVLIRNKVAGFIITGGQDNVQGVAGQMLTFFSELGFLFPQFPFIAHSRGWSAEDMERNVIDVLESAELHEGAMALVDRAVEMVRLLQHRDHVMEQVPRGGRKAHQLEVEEV